jgi:hypothetical protein
MAVRDQLRRIEAGIELLPDLVEQARLDDSLPSEAAATSVVITVD